MPCTRKTRYACLQDAADSSARRQSPRPAARPTAAETKWCSVTASFPALDLHAWQDFKRLQFELREFREVPCPGVYLAALQGPQTVQPEFLDGEAAQY